MLLHLHTKQYDLCNANRTQISQSRRITAPYSKHFTHLLAGSNFNLLSAEMQALREFHMD